MDKPAAEQTTLSGDLLQYMKDVKHSVPVQPCKGLSWPGPDEVINPATCIWYKDMAVPTFACMQIDAIESLQFDPSDIILCGQFKSGTTWISEILYHLVTGGKELFNCDIPTLLERVPTLTDGDFGVATIGKRPPPRLIRSHMHYQALPESYKTVKPKTIYIMRNPRDLCVSQFKFHQALVNAKFTGSFSDFYEGFILGNVMYGPFTRSIKSFWENRDKLNILFVSYENVHKDFEREVRRIAAFLNITLGDELLRNIRKATTLEFMRTNESVNYGQMEDQGFLKFPERGGFMRKGQVADWRNYFSEEQCRRMNEWMDKELTPLGITFCYQI